MFIDATGKPCPMPVVMAKKEMDNGEKNLTVAVDNETAVENLKRLADSRKYTFCVNEADGVFHVCMLADSHVPQQQPETEPEYIPCCTGYAVFIGKDYVGAGDEVLGKNLMKMALYTLSQSDNVPETVIFMNSGVKLPTSDDAQTVDSIKALAAKGCQVIACGTCLDYYGLKESLKVGKVSNMYEIIEKMQVASKVITL